MFVFNLANELDVHWYFVRNSYQQKTTALNDIVEKFKREFMKETSIGNFDIYEVHIIYSYH